MISCSATQLLHTIQSNKSGLTLAEILVQHPDMARRTVQRLIAELIQQGHIMAIGQARARRYQVAGA